MTKKELILEALQTKKVTNIVITREYFVIEFADGYYIQVNVCRENFGVRVFYEC